MSLERRTALVTGAAGAIGSAIARRLAQDGARLLLVDISSDGVEKLAASLGDDAQPLRLDLSDLDAVAAAAQSLAAENQIDVLVNNAGILSNNKLAETELGEWSRVNTINLDAAFVLSRALLPAMRQRRWGRIVNMSSFAAKSGGLTAGTAYTVSKASLIGLTFAVARECAADGVTVNAIAPAYVMSPMVSVQLSEAQRREQIAKIPVGRFCEPEEVAHTVAFLASPLAGFITGEVIDMNGGLQFD